METKIEINDLKEKDIDMNLKFYKEAAWFINRIRGFDTMSDEEIIKTCDMAAILSRKKKELKQTW